MEGYNPGRTRSTSADITPPLQLQTEYQIGGDTQFGSPVVVADNTLFSEGERKLHAINLTDGTERWQINLAG
ncbi:MAG: PQQ-like beta-propeller repeat protein, partial [Caldilineaceae bacterium]|nr:PQQ-like beta-propeller repeat protein [Caldilineaceae bacterium]